MNTHLITHGSDAVLLIHGGVSNIKPESISAAMLRRYHQKLEQALHAGYQQLQQGESSVKAVIEAIKVLEDSPLFNAGRGSALTCNERIEMDASLMNGENLRAGSVAGLNCVKNPITAAKAVIEHTWHVLLAGKGANDFARKIADKANLTIVDQDYFWTKTSYTELQQFLERKRRKKPPVTEQKLGTVGAVALDKKGNLAAGTSTGGITGKMPGRVSDSAIIGASTYADNQTCAVSTTGQGEYFIRYVAAYDVISQMRYQQKSVIEAARHIIQTIHQAGAMGGLITLDKNGNFALPYNGASMFRGFVSKNGSTTTMI